MQTEGIQQLCNQHYPILGQNPTRESVTQLIKSLIPSWIQHDQLLRPLLKKDDPQLWHEAVRATEHTIEIFGDVLRNEHVTTQDQANILNQQLIKALQNSTKEFYYYLLKQQKATKKAIAEAEGYTIMDEGLVAMTFNGIDYVVQYFSCIIDLEENENAQLSKERITLLRKSEATISDILLSEALDNLLFDLKS